MKARDLMTPNPAQVTPTDSVTTSLAAHEPNTTVDASPSWRRQTSAPYLVW